MSFRIVRKAPDSVEQSISGTVMRALTTVSTMLYRSSSSSSSDPVLIFVPFSVVSKRSTYVRMEPTVLRLLGKSGALNLAWNSVSTNGVGVTPR